ncbi:hypothetical protein OV207_15805 [Corallococcus sp. BB11-1]|uniref:hypothetical protein n=1 Tax=Corallococcus sp. BB11-1 TaxID=2996783 RepID=UPI00227051FA|nr:hypothetical protein [Corallococcus sp. BB11-1]MCY1032936.1 hypothetical protein [Corallococcus sp. BB11-1]
MRLHPLLFAVMLSACASRGPASRPASSEPSETGEASSRASPAPPVEDASPSGDYGTAHPFLFMDSAQDGRWLLACQAREDTDGDGHIKVTFGHHGHTSGDALRPYLFLEPGAGIPIDELVAVDPTGRFLVLVRDATLALFDVETREQKVLASGVTPDTTSPRPTSRASFSQDGQRLLFLRPQGETSVAVVRDLRQGTERVLDAGKGLIGQVLLDPSGHWAVFDVVEDTDGDGKQTWPQQKTTLASAMCRGPVRSSSSYGWQGDRPVRRLRRVEGGPLLQQGDVVQPLGEGMLRRAPDQSIFFEHADGRKETWVPAGCAGMVVHADAERRQLLVACDTKQDLIPLELHGASIHQPLGWRTSMQALESSGSDSGRDGRLVSLEVESKTQPSTGEYLVVDMKRHTAQSLLNQEPVAFVGAWALLKESIKPTAPDRQWTHRLRLWNAETGKDSVVSGSGSYFQAWAGDTGIIMGKLIDLRAGQVLGDVEDEPLALDTRGRALRPSPTSKEPPGSLMLGPVRWEPALKPPTPAPPAPGAP